ncbi:hypothetical protein K491DRAFT_302383 [Lophiostoma macrostomum CBS 122681]|uniref:Uncharacterized protein n=1 Tax=Lophiostoma macrostomum CBS 122681 TaxID=1314788 RepID=A0A6A6TGG4_9PLEO|nr:hypothetical protein K491DRAFT_302383 [Lophiostoma macrostomum CBS 122681]
MFSQRRVRPHLTATVGEEELSEETVQSFCSSAAPYATSVPELADPDRALCITSDADQNMRRGRPVGPIASLPNQ